MQMMCRQFQIAELASRLGSFAPRVGRLARALVLLLLILCCCGLGADQTTTAPTGLEEARLRMSKWIETQQIISKERNEWQQGKEILVSRLDLVKKEIASLREKVKEAEAGIAETNANRQKLVSQNDELKATGAQLAQSVTGMEQGIRRLMKSLPEPIRTKLEPLYQRIPEDPANTRVSVAERFQNALGILNEVNKANNEITVNYEVHTMANGTPTEVQVMYVGLAQAYYVSGKGESGIGQPGEENWTWNPSNAIAADVLMALEILQGKHTPAFVPLPVTLK